MILLEDRRRVMRGGAEMVPEVSLEALGSSPPVLWKGGRGLPVLEKVYSSVRATFASPEMVPEGRSCVHGRAAGVQDVYCPYLYVRCSSFQPSNRYPGAGMVDDLVRPLKRNRS